MRSQTSQQRFPLDYFLLVFILTIPFYVIGGSKLPLPINLPVSALGSLNPMIAAAILSYRRGRWRGVQELFKRVVDYRKIKNKAWYIPTLLLMPSFMLLSYAFMRMTGMPLPDPIEIPLLVAPLYFLFFLIGAVGEELGWTGYAIDPLQNRRGALNASLILGVIWAIWHSIPFIQTGNPANWIFWQSVTTVGLRILMVWIYNNTAGSVFTAILFHDMINLSEFLFPNNGSHYDPFAASIFIWLAAAIVIFIWGPRTLARYRFARTLSPGS